MPHPLGIRSSSKEVLESVGSGFVAHALLEARLKTIAAVKEVATSLKEGMTEPQARKLALAVFADRGVKKHWHQPYIRLGQGTLLTFKDPLQTDEFLKPGDPIAIDVGPVWEDPSGLLEYEGDYGDTFVFGENPEAQKCIEKCHELFSLGTQLWHKSECTGRSLYEQLKVHATQMGYVWVEPVNGHRLGDFPHHKHSKQSLSQIEFVPASGLWVLEIQIAHRHLPVGAFFEDLLLEHRVI